MKSLFDARRLRLLSLLLCAALLLGLAACGSGKEEAQEPEAVEALAESAAAPTPEPTPSPTPSVESLAIYYMEEPIKDNDCTAYVGDTLPLSIVSAPWGVSGEVKWSIDKTCEDCFVLTVNENDPSRCELHLMSILPDGVGGAKISAALYGAVAEITVHVRPGEGGVTTLKLASADQTVEICRARSGNPVYDFVINPGYETRLSAKPLKGGSASDVIWSMDAQAGKALCFTASTAHPGEMILECFASLPEGVPYVEIYAELDGVKTTCRVRIEG